jgi:aminopeptidase-like protein
MNLDEFKKIMDNVDLTGSEMFQLMTKLYPICRSITGNGVRQTLAEIKNHIDLKVNEIPTNKKVFDWTIPKEWNISDAYVLDPKGNKVVDFKKSNLHVVSYSVPISKKMPLEELKQHIHTLPDQPNTIPYLTTYYKDDWGICMTHNEFLKLQAGEYEVVIDSTLNDGSLTYGEFLIKGKTSEEILISCYVCHPSMCNDNLSGVVLATALAKQLSKIQMNYSVRFLFIPETIGAITWLALNEKNLSKLKHGLVATCLGDPGVSTYKKTKHGKAEIDRTVEFVLKNSGKQYQILDFFPTGSDERQFCSPGFNLPVGSLMRTPYGRFQQYHTSDDNLEFVKAEFLADTYRKYLNTIFVLENNKKYLNLNPKCEPQLGKRGLYRQIGGQKTSKDSEAAMFWLLSFSDGSHDLIDISEKSGIQFEVLHDVALKLQESKLLKAVT